MKRAALSSQGDESFGSRQGARIGLLPVLLLFTFLSVGVGFFNALYASYRVQKERALDNALRSSESYAIKYAEAIDVYLDAIGRQLDAGVQTLSADPGPRARQAELARLQGQVDAPAAVMLMDASGAMLAGGATPWPPEIPPAQRLSAAAAGRAIVSVAPSGRAWLLFARAMPPGRADAAAFLMMAVDLLAGSRMERLIADRGGEAGTRVFLLGQQGQVLYQPAGQRIEPGILGLAPVMRAGAMTLDAPGGDAALVGFAPVAAGHWAVIVRQSASAALAPVWTLLRESLKAALPSVALTLALVCALAYAVAAPLRRLSAALAGQGPGVAAGARAWYAEAALLSGAVQAALVQHRDEVGRLNRQGRTDPLTGLANRRALDETLAQWADQTAPCAIAALDIDYFKRINDRCGHAAGDQVLVTLARAVRGSIREQDRAFRVGGEEFIVLLPGASQAVALEVAQRLRQALARAPMPAGVGVVTLSAGIAHWLPRQDDPRAALERADQALYAAKAAGRDRIICWSPQG